MPEFEKNTKLNDIFIVLGFATDTIDGNKYGKSNLFNNNYLLVFTGYLQYTLYTSEYSKSAFSVSFSQINNYSWNKLKMMPKHLEGNIQD